MGIKEQEEVKCPLYAKQAIDFSMACFGASEGNRTLVLSLGSFRSTIELHSHG